MNNNKLELLYEGMLLREGTIRDAVEEVKDSPSLPPSSIADIASRLLFDDKIPHGKEFIKWYIDDRGYEDVDANDYQSVRAIFDGELENYYYNDVYDRSEQAAEEAWYESIEAEYEEFTENVLKARQHLQQKNKETGINLDI